MKHKCGICLEPGHNARGCPKKGTAKTAKAAKSGASPAPTGTVTEALITRKQRLEKELATLNRVLKDLDEVGIS